jgi:AraC family transcriptional regulator of adaptative response/methylated-DNA-[protein]-cysteine methyltransferase
METNNIVYRVVDSPIGKFIAGATRNGCCVFEFEDRGGKDRITSRLGKRYGLEVVEGSNRLLDSMVSQVVEYFEGKRKTFDLQLDLAGTPFESAVWGQLQKIPYGETRSYGEIAALLGKPGAARAVGRANGANYLPIIIPCHRVIEADGSLRGYGGGLWRKKYLLQLEKKGASA